MAGMAGAIAVTVFILFVLVPGMLIAGGVISAIVGWAAKSNAEAEHEDSPLIDLNY